MKLLHFFIACTCATALNAQTQSIVIPLWPDGAPTSNCLEDSVETNVNNLVYNVSVPILEFFPAAEPNGQIVIDCPGGGYALLAWGHEGVDMAPWFNDMGITLAVLKYRMPNGHKEVPLEDSRRAIELVRQHAAEWGGDTSKVGIMGSSAGGHFAATLATLYGDKEHRPDFQILFYPVISMEQDLGHDGTRANLLGSTPTAEEIEHYTLYNRVDAETPPAFVVLSADDECVPPGNSLRYCEALSNNKVPYSLHIYPTGGHGWGNFDTFTYKPEWTAELARWLKSL